MDSDMLTGGMMSEAGEIDPLLSIPQDPNEGESDLSLSDDEDLQR